MIKMRGKNDMSNSPLNVSLGDGEKQQFNGQQTLKSDSFTWME